MVGGGYCRLQMPLKLALAVRGTGIGRALCRRGLKPLRTNREQADIHAHTHWEPHKQEQKHRKSG